MTPDPKLPARAILRAQHELQRRGWKHLLEALERDEPDLAEHLMESLSRIHGDLLQLGGPPKATQRLQRQIQNLLLVCITALRRDGRHDPPEPDPVDEAPVSDG